MMDEQESPNMLLGPVDLELSNSQIESICDLINNPIERNDVRQPNNNAHQIQFRTPTIPPFAQFDNSRRTFPSFNLRQTILDAINTNSVTLIKGGTGCGKSTQVPQYILEDCSQTRTPCKIFCTQPRRLAAMTVAKRVATERNETVPGAVGYQVRLDNCTNPTSSLIFMTR